MGLIHDLDITVGDLVRHYFQVHHTISNGNRTEWSPIRSVII